MPEVHGAVSFDAYMKFFNQARARQTTVKEHLTNFNNRVDVIEHSGGSFSQDPGMLRYVLYERKEKTVPKNSLQLPWWRSGTGRSGRVSW